MDFVTRSIESKNLMKQFIKTIPARHSLARELKRLHGAEAYAYLTMLLDLAQDIGVFELTPQIVSAECGLKSQKVGRIFEDLKRIFEESLRILGLSSNIPQESLKNPELSSKNPERSTPSNPHGSTRDQEENREEKKEERREEKSPSPEMKKSLELACGYAKHSASNHNVGWLVAYLNSFFVLNRDKYAHLSDADIYECWQQACKTWDKGKSYVQGTFENKLSEYVPTPQSAAPVVAKSEFEKLQGFPYIGSNTNGEIYKPEQLRMDETHSNIVWSDDGVMHYIGHLQGLMEKPAHVG